jgi:hypothetical protein
MKYSFLTALVSLTVLLSGCQKANEKDSDSDPDPNCVKIKNVKIVAEKDSITVGDDLHLGINETPDIALYIWTRGGDPTMISNDETLDINYAEKSDEGWYYLNVSYPDCESHVDSIYITVKNKLVTAPCSPTNNTVTFSSIPDISPATVGWSYNTSWNRRVLAAHGAYGYPDFNIYFNTYWDTTEPEDGEYSITTMSDTDEYPPYTVYISSLYSSILFQAGSGKIYVSHVNGKLRVTFCSVSLTGSNGSNSFTTTASGMLTAP